jgi:DnaJ-class molecular chaperone
MSIPDNLPLPELPPKELRCGECLGVGEYYKSGFGLTPCEHCNGTGLKQKERLRDE